MDRPLLFSSFEPTYGPISVISRGLMEMEQALRNRGVFLEFVDPDDLIEINRREADDWPFLIPTFNTSFNDLAETDCIAIVGRDRRGEIVATQAVRLFDWSLSNFKNAAESLRLFYDHPGEHALPGEACIVTAKVASNLSGKFAYSGAAWNDPRLRRTGIVQLLPRISRVMALTQWNVETVGTVMAEELVEAGVHRKVGYTGFEWGVTFKNSRMSPEDVNLQLQWIKSPEIIDDLRAVRMVIAKDNSVIQLPIRHNC